MDQNPEPLYERDFYLWLDQQIKIIEAGNLTNLDVTNLVEEVKKQVIVPRSKYDGERNRT